MQAGQIAHSGAEAVHELTLVVDDSDPTAHRNRIVVKCGRQCRGDQKAERGKPNPPGKPGISRFVAAKQSQPAPHPGEPEAQKWQRHVVGIQSDRILPTASESDLRDGENEDYATACDQAGKIGFPVHRNPLQRRQSLGRGGKG